MKSRDPLLLLGAALVLLVTGWLLFGPDGGEAMAGDRTLVPTASAPAPADTPVSGAPVPELVGSADPDAPPPAMPGGGGDLTGVDPEAGTGVIRGDIVLEGGAAQNVRRVQVLVQEGTYEKAPPGEPWSRRVTIDIEPGLGAPGFRIAGVPFSEHGFTVSAHAQGAAGDDGFVRVDAGHPVADVRLRMYPGVPFSMLVRDQRRDPCPDVVVHLRPVGKPFGRPTPTPLPTDGFGSVIFENVLPGPYKIFLGNVSMPLAPPTDVVVGPGGVQSKVLTLGRGTKVVIEAMGPARLVQGARVRLLDTQTQLFTELEGETDRGGKAVFEHVRPSIYQVTVTAPGFQHWSRKLTVVEGEREQVLRARLVP